jgi:hypothetical protein
LDESDNVEDFHSGNFLATDRRGFRRVFVCRQTGRKTSHERIAHLAAEGRTGFGTPEPIILALNFHCPCFFRPTTASALGPTAWALSSSPVGAAEWAYPSSLSY